MYTFCTPKQTRKISLEIFYKKKVARGLLTGANAEMQVQVQTTVQQADLYEEIFICMYVYRVSQEECARLREGVPYAKVYRYNPKYLCPKLNSYGDNGQ